MTAPTGLRIIGDLSSTTWGAGSITDKTAHDLFEQPPAAPPPADNDAIVAAPATGGIVAADTKVAEIPATPGPAAFWASRANQATRVRQVLARAQETADVASLTAALRAATDFFATLAPGVDSANGRPAPVQLDAITSVYDAFVPVARKALGLIDDAPEARELQGAVVAAVARANETATNDDVAALAELVSAKKPNP